MDPTIVSLISVGTGAFVTLLGVFLSNWFLMRNAREQWSREHKADQEKWIREKLQEIYSNCIYYLGRTNYVLTNHASFHNAGISYEEKSKIEGEKLRIEYEQLDLAYKQLETDVNKLNTDFFNEKQRWLNLLVVYHPFRDTPEFDEFLTKMREGKIVVEDITGLSARDPRLHGNIKKLSKL